MFQTDDKPLEEKEFPDEADLAAEDEDAESITSSLSAPPPVQSGTQTYTFPSESAATPEDPAYSERGFELAYTTE